jgi:RNA polymerase sigma factor (sigma-70 family)
MSTTHPPVAGADEQCVGFPNDDACTYYSGIKASLDALLLAARPRLLRLARLQGIAPDSAEDVVQETVVTAWRRLSFLRQPDRFDSWIDGICRNLCRLQHREQRAAARQQVSLAARFTDEGVAAEEYEYENEVVAKDTHDGYGYGLDSTVSDPVEELSQDDLAALLDRALGYLPDSAREVLEICCLEGLPQREAALQLGLTIGALEVRLHRARRRLRLVLSRDLRAEAEAFGLTIDEEAAGGWREMREWCFWCGRCHLRGKFEPMADGRVGLLVRCPTCWQRYGAPVCDFRNTPSPPGSRSLKPALKRSFRAAAQRAAETLAMQRPTCSLCHGDLVQLQVMSSPECAGAGLPNRSWLVADCARCGRSLSSPLQAVWLQPAVQHFIAQHRRWVYEPETLARYQDQPALRLRLADYASSARLSLLTHPQTLAVFAAFEH